ncbi:MAG: GMC family oxidoreductase N-terminal domain-containing protein [Rhodanobacter sp.]
MSGPLGTFDHIVVGAGPAGCAAATRLALAQPQASVLLVETGPAKSGIRSDVPLGIATLVPFRNARNYSYRTVPQAGLDGRRGVQPRGRGLGGSSLINAMIYIRGQREDYDGWARLGADGWAWRDVLPYFLRSEDNARGADGWHATGGPLAVSDLASPSECARAFVEAAVQCGHPRNTDFNGASQEGVGLYQVFQRHGRRWNAARAYLAALAPKNLAVLSDTPVARVLVEHGRACGIACADGTRYAARGEVVLSAGAFGTPQLLMLSGIGPAGHLHALGIPVLRDSPEVGANLQDHVDFVISRAVNDRGLFGTVPSIVPQAVRAIAPFRRGSGLLTSNVAEAGGFLRSRPELERPDIQLHLCIGIVDNHSRRLHATRGLSLHTCVLRPHSRGHVRLASADVRHAPLIDPAFLADERDMETLLAGTALARRILAAPAFARYAGPALYDAETDDEARLRGIVRAHADTIYHPAGTCRMGSDAASAVDPELRVRGIANLRVADASVMPTLISGNTQAACAMIGERAAEFVARC